MVHQSPRSGAMILAQRFNAGDARRQTVRRVSDGWMMGHAGFNRRWRDGETPPPATVRWNARLNSRRRYAAARNDKLKVYRTAFK